MVIKQCLAVAVLRVSMTIRRMREEGQFMFVSETDDNSGFSMYIPKRVAKKKGIAVGHELDALIIPSSDLCLTREVLALGHRTKPGGVTAHIYDKGEMWSELMIG